MTDVIFEEQPVRHGWKMGVACLNAPSSLNALSLQMIDLLTTKLLQWKSDPAICCVLLKGAGDKAFCAGGDVVRLYESMRAAPHGPNPYAMDFFSREYRLDYLIHEYPKPLLCLGNGIVMGGGLGLLVGAPIRIVSHDTRMAMPEITIGLYPDVGATWFLNRMPAMTGMFLGMTGASINGRDAIDVGLADILLSNAAVENLAQELKTLDWGIEESSHHDQILLLLQRLAQQDKSGRPEPVVMKHIDLMAPLAEATTMPEAVQAILSMKQTDRWLQRAIANLKAGCPTTAALVFHQMQLKELSLADCFRHELIMSMQCALHGEFCEGVRALLVDKDLKPRWQYPDFSDLPSSWVNAHFDPPWGDGPHPLCDL